MKFSKDVASVDDLIARRRKEQNQKRMNRFMVVLSLFAFTLVSSFGLYSYFTSPLSSIHAVLISGNQIYSDEAILKRSGIAYDDWFFAVNAASLRKLLVEDPLIRDVDVRLTRNNEIVIQVSENKVTAIWMDQGKVVLADGSLLEMQVDYAKAWLFSPGIYGYEDEGSVAVLIAALNGLTASSLGNVSEIHRHPTSYDENYVKVIMQDGNRVYTGLSTLDMLEEYPRIVNALNTANSCIFFDEMTRTAFSQPCEN